RLLDVVQLLAHDRDRERVAVLDEDPSVAVEDNAARRPQANGLEMVVGRHLAVLRVLHDLQAPEEQRHDGEADNEEDPEAEQAGLVDPAPLRHVEVQHHATTTAVGRSPPADRAAAWRRARARSPPAGKGRTLPLCSLWFRPA